MKMNTMHLRRQLDSRQTVCGLPIYPLAARAMRSTVLPNDATCGRCKRSHATYLKRRLKGAK